MSTVHHNSKPWEFRLYLNGQNPAAPTVLRAVQDFLEAEAPGEHALEVVDVHAEPERAEVDRILALPSLVRVRPHPTRVVIGNCSNRERMRHLLDRFAPPPARPPTPPTSLSQSEA